MEKVIDTVDLTLDTLSQDTKGVTLMSNAEPWFAAGHGAAVNLYTALENYAPGENTTVWYKYLIFKVSKLWWMMQKL